MIACRRQLGKLKFFAQAHGNKFGPYRAKTDQKIDDGEKTDDDESRSQ